MLGEVLRKNSVTAEEVFENLSIDESIWKKIYSGHYLPTKNLIFSIALIARISYEDACLLLETRGMEFDYTLEREVVVSYLLKQKVFNADMVRAAFEEYAVENLFVKWLED